MRVVIVGGGFSGLLTAANLRARGVDDVVVLERGDRAGGVARTIERDGYILEPAAGSLMLPHPGLTPLVVGEVEPAASAARLRHVWDGSRLITITPGPKALLAPLASPVSKLRAAAELVLADGKIRPDESLDRFLRRRFGDEVGRLGAWLAASGVFAGDPALLAADSAFPALRTASASGPILRSFLPPGAPPPSVKSTRRNDFLPPGAQRRRGESASAASRRGAVRKGPFIPRTTMSDLAASLARPLGDRFRSGITVAAVRRDKDGWVVDGTERHTADHVVITTGPHITSAMVGGDLAENLAGPVHAPVVVVGLGGRWMELPDGFGILSGPKARTATRGVLLESSYAPHRAPERAGLVKVIAGGLPDPSITEADDQTVIETVGTEVARMIGHDLDVSFAEVVRHYPGIPQYTLGHGDWLRRVEASVPNSLHLTGWGYRGVGISHLATDAARIADRIVTE